MPEYQYVDADNHFYEAADAFYRHGTPRVKRFVQWPEQGEKKFLMFGGAHAPGNANPTFDPVAKLGALHETLKALAAGASVLFPSGWAFGYQAYPRADGSTLWSEAWVSGPQGPVGATLVELPWLTSAEHSGERFVIELDGPAGREHIEAETLAHSVGMGRGSAPTLGHFLITHGMARYRRNGEEAVGMIERSTIVGPRFR